MNYYWVLNMTLPSGQSYLAQEFVSQVDFEWHWFMYQNPPTETVSPYPFTPKFKMTNKSDNYAYFSDWIYPHNLQGISDVPSGEGPIIGSYYRNIFVLPKPEFIKANSIILVELSANSAVQNRNIQFILYGLIK